MKSGNLNFLEPSGPLQACNGSALPFFYCPDLNLAPDSALKDFYTIAGGCIRTKLLAIFDMDFKIWSPKTFLVTASFGIPTFIFFWKVQYFYITALRNYGVDLIWTYNNHGTDSVCDVLT